jgi:hypothetical protein
MCDVPGTAVFCRESIELLLLLLLCAASVIGLMAVDAAH